MHTFNLQSFHSHLQTNYSKTFQRSNVDFLETPELTSTMLVPGNYPGACSMLLCASLLPFFFLRLHDLPCFVNGAFFTVPLFKIQGGGRNICLLSLMTIFFSGYFKPSTDSCLVTTILGKFKYKSTHILQKLFKWFIILQLVCYTSMLNTI